MRKTNPEYDHASVIAPAKWVDYGTIASLWRDDREAMPGRSWVDRKTVKLGTYQCTSGAGPALAGRRALTLIGRVLGVVVHDHTLRASGKEAAKPRHFFFS
jgi:hypothetical protein